IILYSESYQHSYPHCWRCKKPVIFRATKQWFLKIDHKNLRCLLRESIQKTKWIPEEGMSRILGMVEMRPDWCLSRQRLWGVALPIVYCENCNSPICNEQTINRVLELISGHGSDIWFEKDLSEILPKNFACPHCGGSVFRKEQDILDVWFDSGVSHLAVLKNHPQLKWPADFYLEGSDQHRGWFQTSLITSCAIENQPPFKNVLTHGFVVDAEGRKMSKSLGNIITPEEIIKRYGADILRLWALSENYQQDMRISQTIIDHLVIVYRTLRNTIRFMLGNLYDYDASVKISESDFLEVDRWAIARLNQLVQDVARYYESCLFHKGLNEIFNFCNIDMSSFYLDYLKDRLYTHAKDSPSRRAGQNVLYQILTHLVIMLAPVLSFTCEEAYSYIPGRKTDSVFLEQWPEIQKPETALLERWQKFFEFRRMVLKQIEEKRVAGQLGSSLEASIEIKADADFRRFLESFQPHLTGLLMIAECKIIDGNSIQITAKKTHLQKCSRCWIHHSTIGRFSQHPQLCEKCFAVVDSLGK
ncbi:MAG TPA: class I tRNA ligase family protein, partial [bacterium]|nr:class I tRNA ligase family protein [bacterium]